MKESHLTVAAKIIDVYEDSEEIQKRVDESPEFYRAMIYETGVVKNPSKIDGGDYYHAIVDELENLL